MAIVRFFRRELKGVHQAALLLAIASFSNAFLGLLRDRFLAGLFGASRTLDIYYTAFRVPDFLFSLSLFFVASTAFIPLFLEKQNTSERSARDFLEAVLTVFCVVMIAIIIVAYIFLPRLIHFLAPGFDGKDQLDAVYLARILLLSPFFLGLSNLASGVLQASRKFLAYALSPIVYNAGIIFGVAILAPQMGLTGAVIGVVLGAILHFAVQLPTLIRIRMVPSLRFRFTSDPFQIFRYSFPRAIALSVNQFTLLLLTALASTFAAGTIAVFNLSLNLYAMPLIVVGLSYSVAAFPLMADLALKNEKSLFFEHLSVSLRHILFWTLPITALFIVLRAHIVRAVLGTGAFAWEGTRLTAASLLLLSVGLVFQSAVTLFVRAYYALGKTREPIIYNVVSAGVTIVVAFLSVWILKSNAFVESFIGNLFRIGDLTSIEFLSLPFAYSVGSFVNALFLGVRIFRLNGPDELRKIRSSFRWIFFVSAIMGFVAYGVLRIADNFIKLDTFFGVVFEGGIAGALAIAVGIALFWILGVPEFIEIRDALKARFSRKDIFQPETEHL